MPTYDYECGSCGHRFEVFQSMSDEPIKRCPKCGKRVRRLIGGGLGVIFKGSGFYVTDNRSSGNGDHHGAKVSTNGKKEKSDTKTGGESTKSGSSDSGSKGTSSSVKESV